MRKSTQKIWGLLFLLPILGGISNALGVCVNNSHANLRSGPGTSYEKVWTVYKYMPLKDIGEKKGWLRVKDVDGYSSWILGSLVTTKYHCAVIRSAKANLREGPGTDYAQTGRGEKYHSFKIVKEKEDWVYIEDEYRHRYWVARELVWLD